LLLKEIADLLNLEKEKEKISASIINVMVTNNESKKATSLIKLCISKEISQTPGFPCSELNTDLIRIQNPR
jgi:hypothetical protein